MKTPNEPNEGAGGESPASEESELLTRVGGGDRASFAELHRRLAAMLFSSAYGILNNREAAEDVTQDVFLQIWEKAPTYDPARGKASTWALTLARNKAIDRLRAAQRRARLRDAATRERQIDWHFDDRDSLHSAVTRERRETVRTLLDRLTPAQREAIRLAYLEDMPYPQVARMLRTPLGTVKARIRRGMQRLRELLASKL